MQHLPRADVQFPFFFSSRRRHTRFDCDWSSDVCSSDLHGCALRQEPLVSGEPPYDGGMKVRTPDPVARLAATLSDLAEIPVELERPADAEHGDYATNVALKLAGLQKRPPREIAEELATQAVERGIAERAEAAGPGFVNLWLPDAWLADCVGELVDAGADFGAGSAEEPERVQVEMVSANPTGPITVASARNGAYGDSVARLLEFAGHTVEREYYYNDSGAQMERFYASVEAVRRGEEPPEDGYSGDYLTELAALSGDPVPHVLASIERTLEQFR